MANVITLDEDIKAREEFRYKCLIEEFGLEEAKKIMEAEIDEDEITDPELLEIINNGGTLENDGQ